MPDTIQMFEAHMVAVADLKPHPRNYREHPEDQLEHIIRSIEQHGFYRNVVAANDYTILAGHGVVKAATKMGVDEIPVIVLDIDPDSPQAMKLLAGDNEISHLAMVNDRQLSELLKDLTERDDLLGTGYDEMMLANLAMVTRPQSEIEDFDAAAEWAGAGMPEHDPGTDYILAKVQFKTEEDAAEFFEKLDVDCDKIRNYTKHGLVYSFWYPVPEQNDLDSLRMEHEGDDGEK